jgi:hypothetical protein
MLMDPTAKIRVLNDALRNLTGKGRVFVTAGISALPSEEQAEIMMRVHGFTAFTPDNDPYGEHDFGSFEYAGKTIFWKIDCYDRDLARSGRRGRDYARPHRAAGGGILTSARPQHRYGGVGFVVLPLPLGGRLAGGLIKFKAKTLSPHFYGGASRHGVKAPVSYAVRFFIGGSEARFVALIGACLVTPRLRRALPQVCCGERAAAVEIINQHHSSLWTNQQFRNEQRKRKRRSHASSTWRKSASSKSC